MRATARARSGSDARRYLRRRWDMGDGAMSTVLENKLAARGGLADKLAFYNGLQAVTNAIHATNQIDEIILDLGQDICNLFDADRLTIYVVCDGGKSIVTKV